MNDNIIDILRAYGFIELNNEQKKSFIKNTLIIPLVMRYQGMGHYQIIARSSLNMEKYHIIHMGGSNGYEAKYAYDNMLRIREEDGIDKNQMLQNVKNGYHVKIMPYAEIGIENDEKNI